MTNGEKFKDVFGFGADGSRIIAVNSTWWDCVFQIRKPKTNAAHIRIMSDEELATLLTDVARKSAEKLCTSLKTVDVDVDISNCDFNILYKAHLNWLKQKAKEGE